MERRIYLFNKKREVFEDCTERIAHIALDGNLYKVTFKGNEIPLSYGKSKVRIEGDDSSIDDSYDVPTFKWEYGVVEKEQILKYFVEYCIRQDVLDDGSKKPQDADEVEDDAPTPFGILANQLVKLTWNDKVVLENYLQHTAPKVRREKDVLWFPFGCNASQMKSVDEAMSHQMSIIEGPPGTGKTQTILNLLANIVGRGMRVAVVSNNNSAVQNVVDKLNKYDYGWMCAQLGSVTRRKAYFEDGQKDVAVSQLWKLSKEEAIRKESNVRNMSEQAMLGFKHQNDLQRNKILLNDTMHEMEIFKSVHVESMDKIEALADAFLLSIKSDNLRLLKSYLTQQFSPLRWFQLIRRFKLYKLGLSGVNDFVCHQDLALSAINYAIYQRSIEELERSIVSAQNWLQHHDMQLILQTLTKDSEYLFKNALLSNFCKVEPKTFSYDSYKSEWSDFMSHHPIVLSSTFSLFSSSGNGCEYDYLIIDEASQVNIPSAIMCFALAKNVVIVGDCKQLTHIVNTEGLNISKEMNSAYDVNVESILSSCKNLFGADIPVTLLKEHYRCQPAIIDFCNQRFYNNEMVIMSEYSGAFPYELNYVDVNRVDYRDGSVLNVRQAMETVECIKRLIASGVPASEIGVIAPYRAHANYISYMLGRDLVEVESDTVHKYQGREKDVIIYNSVMNELNEFNDNPNLINVAVSRAKNRFIVIAPEQVTSDDRSNLASLCKYIQYHDPDCRFIRHSAFASIFDVLYRQDRLEFEQGASRGGESPAERIFREMLERVFSSASNGPTWNFKQEYYLFDLFKGCDVTCLSVDEMRYVLNGARLDFLVYDEFSHLPVLAIEVDGTQHMGPKQHAHDVMKDHILSLLGIPFRRFRTNSARGQEEKAVRQLLNEIYLMRRQS